VHPFLSKVFFEVAMALVGVAMRPAPTCPAYFMRVENIGRSRIPLDPWIDLLFLNFLNFDDKIFNV